MSEQRFLNHRDKSVRSKQPPLAVAATPMRKPSSGQRGTDPYNTSGSFDRKNNWARVGKR